MSEIITTLHPDNDETVNLYPNIKKENIPNGSIDVNRLNDDVKSLLESINELHPSGVDTAAHILAFTSNKGIYIGSDDGNWYYWNGTQYVVGGLFQAVQLANGVEDKLSSLDKTVNPYLYTQFKTARKLDIYSDKFTAGKVVKLAITEWGGDTPTNMYCFAYKNGVQSTIATFTTFNQIRTITLADNYDYLSFYLLTPSAPVIETRLTCYCYILENNTISTRLDAVETTINNSNIQPIFYVGPTREYTSFTACINYINNNNIKNAVVYVDRNNYDLFTEQGGSNYFDSYDHTINGYGLVLKNNIHIIMATGAKLLFNYTGSNTEVLIEYSPLNSGELGFTLENCNIECSNCRYAFHDERKNSTESYHNKFINCNFKIDNSNNASWGIHQALGGGLGKDGEIVIDSCVFESVGMNEADVLTYHNCYTDDYAQSKIVVKNCYTKGVTGMSFRYIGNSQRITPVYVSNCSTGFRIACFYEIPTAPYVNVVLYKWCNELRS